MSTELAVVRRRPPVVVDHAGAADAGVETGQERPPAEQPPPPDRPGAEGAPSRADSRTAAASGPATDQAADDRQSKPSPVASRDPQGSSQESAPDQEDTESPEQDTGADESAEPAGGEPKEREAGVGEETDDKLAIADDTDDRAQRPVDQGKEVATAPESKEDPEEGTAALESGDQSEPGRDEDAGADQSPSMETDTSAGGQEADQRALPESDEATADESAHDQDTQDPAEAPLSGDAEDVADQLPDDELINDASDGAPSATNDAEETSEPGEDMGGAPDTEPEVEPGQHQEKTEAVEPLTDAEYVEHAREVTDKLEAARASGRATDQVHTVDPDREQWTADRLRVQREIVNDLYAKAADIPNDGEAIIAGGLGGAGKSTVLEGYAGIDQSQYLIINPDAIKEEMARRDLIPGVEGLSPMEVSDLVHEESSQIAKRLARMALADGKTLIWDITMSSQDSTGKRIDALREAGYRRIEGVFVAIPVETSVQRAQARHRRGHEAYRNGKGEGGRYVPDEVIRANEDPEWGSSNRRTFEQVKDRFDAWSVYDNSIDGRAPVLLDSSGRKEENHE